MNDRQEEAVQHDQAFPETGSSETPATEPQQDAPEAVPHDSNMEGNATESVEQLQEEIESLREELANTQDRLLRTAAEYQNFRRRNLEIRQESMDFGRMSTLEHLLDVYDDLTRTVEAIPEVERDDSKAALESLSQGVRLVQEKFTAQLKKMGVEPIEVIGMPFDEEVHEAVMQQPAPEGVEPGHIVMEVQRGYSLGDRVLRHPKVVVAGEPSEA